MRGRTELFAGAYIPGYFPLLPPMYDVTRDGRSFLMLQPVARPEQAFVVVLNWFDQLRRRGASR